MTATGQTSFSEWWASRHSSPYWQKLPMRSTWRLLGAASITFGGIGFVIDLLLLNYQPLVRGFFWPLYSATFGAVGLAARIKRSRLLPVILLATLLGLWLAVRVSFHSFASSDLDVLHRRVAFDATGILVGTILGYRLLVDFIRTEGLATVRMQTELALAHGIQATLVPPLTFHV